MAWFRSVLEHIVLLLLISLIVSSLLYYLLEQWLGWNEARTVTGAVIFALGAMMRGNSSGSHLADKARGGPIRTHDIELLKRDHQQRLGMSASMMIVGIVVFAVAILFP